MSFHRQYEARNGKMTRLAVLFTQGYADWECAHLMASGRGYFGFEIAVVTPRGEGVTSSGGVQIVPDGALETIDPSQFDGLVICGGTIWQTPDAPDVAPVARRFHEAGKLVAAICAGVGALARTGLLNAVSHTGNSAEALIDLPGYDGQAHYRETPRAVRAEGFVTAAGTAPVSFMAEIFRALGYGGPDLDAYIDMLAAEHR
jgi:putative intracellular protease/amidase